MKPSSFAPVAWAVCMAVVGSTGTLHAQLIPQPPQIEQIQVDASDSADAPAKDDAKENASGPADAPAAPRVKKEVGLMSLHMRGEREILKGRLLTKHITVETEFGKLTIPVEEIRSFRPGLGSNSQLRAEIDGLIESLGSEDAAQRERAHQALLKHGLPIRGELQRLTGDANPRRVEHGKKLLEALDKLEAETPINQDDPEDGPPPLWLRDDTVVTNDFTLVGRISPATFQIGMQFGTLNVPLADILRAERDGGGREPFHRSISVSGQHIVQRSFKSSGVRVERGDRIRVTATGTMIMSPWGSNALSTPDGSANYGWYVNGQIYVGALVAKIGSGGTVFKVGANHSFTAKKSGVLHFAVGMHPSYSTQTFPGDYKVSVRVNPGDD